jgi:ankyrin repeat protein
MYTKKLFIFSLLITNFSISCMEIEAIDYFAPVPNEIIDIIVGQIDNLSAIGAFASTCKQYNVDYSALRVFYTNHAIHSSENHTKALVGCAQTNNEKIFELIIASENEVNKSTRRNLFAFFNFYDIHRTLPCAICSMIIYQGVGLYDECNYYQKAALEDNVTALTVLLMNKARVDNINKKDLAGRTPLMNAVINKHINIVQLLLNTKVCQKNIKDIVGNTALHHACFDNSIDIIELFIRNKCHLNRRNNNNRTPLHIATMLQYLEIAKILVQNGARLNIRTIRGQTALDYLSADKRKWLLSFKPQVSIKRKHSDNDKQQQSYNNKRRRK